MIKFKIDGRHTKDGKHSVGFGLSAENIKRLQDGQPIVVDLSQMGINAEVFVFYGETEQEMMKLLQPYLNKDTKIHGTP